MRTCGKCGESKPLEGFSRQSKEKTGRSFWCLTCRAAYMKIWRRRMPVEDLRSMQWRENLKRKYGLTPDDYDLILTAQGNACAICRKPPKDRRLHIDHDHETGEIRSLLCSCCNTAIGQLQDDPDLAQAAADYLYAMKSRRRKKAA